MNECTIQLEGIRRLSRRVYATAATLCRGVHPSRGWMLVVLLSLLAWALFQPTAIAETTSTTSETTEEENATKIMAAYIFNFIKFTTWPEDRFENKESPYVITVVDEPVLYKLLSQAVKDKVVNERTVKVVHVSYAAPLKSTETPPESKPEAETGDKSGNKEAQDSDDKQSPQKQQDQQKQQQQPQQSQDQKTATPTETQVTRAAFVDQINASHIVFLGHDDKVIVTDLAALCTDASALYVCDSKNFATAGGMVGFVVSERRLTFEINLEKTDLADIRISSKLLQLATIVKTDKSR